MPGPILHSSHINQIGTINNNIVVLKIVANKLT